MKRLKSSSAVSALLTVLSFAGLAHQPALGQEGVSEAEEVLAMSDRVSLSFVAGATITIPSGSFPSLIFVESEVPTGRKGSELATTGLASHWIFSTYLPTGRRFGLGLEVGSASEAIRFLEDESTPPIRMDLQRVHLAISGRYYLVDSKGVSAQGSTSFGLFADAGFAFGPGPIGDRVESTLAADSAGNVVIAVEGSFQGGDPFCGGIGVRGGVYGVLMVDEHIEMTAGTSYTALLTPVFSDEALPENDLRLTHIGISLGIGYRF